MFLIHGRRGSYCACDSASSSPRQHRQHQDRRDDGPATGPGEDETSAGRCDDARPHRRRIALLWIEVPGRLVFATA